MIPIFEDNAFSAIPAVSCGFLSVPSRRRTLARLPLVLSPRVSSPVPRVAGRHCSGIGKDRFDQYT